MIPNDHHETKTSEVGAAAVECIEFGDNDYQHKSGSSIVGTGDFDARTDLLECPIGSGNWRAVSEEDGKGYIVKNEECFPIACKSTCSLTVNETDLSNCGTSREGNSSSLGNDSSAAEKNVRDDVGIVCGLNAAMNDEDVYESHLSKSPQSTEAKVGVENDSCSTEHKAEENSKLRARRKSKYLSPPFVEPVKGEPSKESESPGDKSIQGSDSPSLVKCGRKRKQSRESIVGSANLATITISSAELLMQLHMIARDHLNPYYNKAFDPTEPFFDSFRASVFSCLPPEVIKSVKKARTDEKDVQKRNKTPVKKATKARNMTASDNKAPSGPCDVILNFASSSPFTVDPQMGCSPPFSNIKPQRKRKMKETNMTAPDNKAPSGPCDVILNFALSSPLTVDPQMCYSPLSSNIKPQRKRKKKAEPLANPGANEMAQIPDLNCHNVVPSATLDPLQVTGLGQPKSEPGEKNVAPSATTLDPLQATGLSEPKSEPGKKKSVRKKGVTPMFSLTGFPYANGNSVNPFSLEVCLQGSGPYSFAASTGLNTNVASSPGFCAEGSTPRLPTPPPELSGFYANGSTPRPPTPPPEFSGFYANGSTPITMAPTPELSGFCAKGSTPRPPPPPPELPGFFAKGSMPRPPPPPQELPGSRAEGSRPPAPPPGLLGFFAKGSIPGPPPPPPGLLGFFAKGSTPRAPTPRAPAPPPGLPGFSAKGSMPRPLAPPPGLPGFGANGSTPRQPAPPPGLQSMKRVNSAVGFDTNKKSGSEMTLDQMKQNLEFMTSMLEKSGDMISPAMRANLEKEIKNLLKKVDPMISSSSS